MSCNYGFNGKTVTARCTDVNTWSAKSPTCTSKIFHSVLFKADGRHKCYEKHRKIQLPADGDNVM